MLTAQADAAFSVAKERCDDLAGNVKDVCIKQAEATHVAALSDAKMGKQMSEARSSAADDKRDADYKVQLEKCDVAAGESRASALPPRRRRSARAEMRLRSCRSFSRFSHPKGGHHVNGPQ